MWVARHMTASGMGMVENPHVHFVKDILSLFESLTLHGVHLHCFDEAIIVPINDTRERRIFW